MSYMLLIIEPPGQRVDRGAEAGSEVYQRLLDFTADLKARGLLLASDSLASATRGARVQVHDGKPRLVDGPFAEAKEMVGGFYLLDCHTRDEAMFGRLAEICG